MAKRHGAMSSTSPKKSHSPKTSKRTAIKHARLAAQKAKKKARQ